MQHIRKPPQQLKASARLAAAEILLELFAGKKPVKPTFDYYSSQAELSTKDRGLTKELVYGVLRRKQELDYALHKLSATPLHKLDPFLHQVLLIGLYQLLFLKRIPDSAAVNEAVASCKMRKKGRVPKRLFGFVNGVLRQAAREKERLVEEIANAEKGRPPLNHPQWMTTRWQQRFGKTEMERICRINNQPPLLSLRINQRKTERSAFCRQLDEREIQWHPARFAPDALLLPERGNINDIPGCRQGVFQVQDQAAQLATLLLAPFSQAGLRLLDACAGLGGKTSYIQQLLMADAELHAVEPEPFRAKKLRETIELHKICTTQFHQKDLFSLTAKQLPLFDRILVDAPCSGTGVIRRHPDIRWNRNLTDIATLQEKQLALLNHAASLAAENAILVYATCSIEQEENEEVLDIFLRNHPEFTLTSPAPFLPVQAHHFLHENFFSPHPEEEIDGFFAARLQKNG